MVITQIGRKKLGGYHACLGDIVRNISKMGVFCSFSEGSLGRFHKSWLKVVRNSFPFSITTELYERFTRL